MKHKIILRIWLTENGVTLNVEETTYMIFGNYVENMRKRIKIVVYNATTAPE